MRFDQPGGAVFEKSRYSSFWGPRSTHSSSTFLVSTH